jgi:hypothetical protein
LSACGATASRFDDEAESQEQVIPDNCSEGCQQRAKMNRAGTPAGVRMKYADKPVVSLRSTTGYMLGSRWLPRMITTDDPPVRHRLTAQ